MSGEVYCPPQKLNNPAVRLSYERWLLRFREALNKLDDLLWEDVVDEQGRDLIHTEFYKIPFELEGLIVRELNNIYAARHPDDSSD